MTLSPECGTPGARALFMVFYRDEGGVQIAQFESCCARHEPAGFTILIDEAEIVQTDIADGYEQNVRDGGFMTTYLNPSPGFSPDPGQPWAWTLGNNPVRKVTPDESGSFLPPLDARRR